MVSTDLVTIERMYQKLAALPKPARDSHRRLHQVFLLLRRACYRPPFAISLIDLMTALQSPITLTRSSSLFLSTRLPIRPLFLPRHAHVDSSRHCLQYDLIHSRRHHPPHFSYATCHPHHIRAKNHSSAAFTTRALSLLH